MAVIEVEGLRKHYLGFRGGTTALDGIDLAVPEGGVYGFLGPNGAGKTTTIRCLLDLIRPTSGECRVLGAPSRGGLSAVIGRIGAIVETPAFFPRFSARRNLLYFARLQGVGGSEVDAALKRVGLGGREKDLVKEYSLGMKQRLGLAAALLKDPELLILDEPAHGLDPAGINEVRLLLRSLGEEGRTVFLSSHLLGEVQAICDRVAILSKGKCVAEGPVAEVIERGRSAGVLVRMDDLSAGRKALDAAGYQVSIEGEALAVTIPPSQAAKVTETLASKGLYLRELRPREVTLEEVFLELTADQVDEP